MKLHSAIFYTNDLDRAVVFFRDVLALEVDYIQEGRFGSFLLGSGKLGIKQAKEEREIPGHQTVFIEVDQIEEYYKTLKSKGLEFHKELVKEEWAVNFSIVDPDGNKVQFLSRSTKDDLTIQE